MNHTKPLLLRMLALFLVVMLTISVVPASVFAEASMDTDETTETLPAAEPPGAVTEATSATEPETLPSETKPEPLSPAEESETISPATEPEPEVPVPLKTDVSYYDNYFAVLSARHENLSFRIVAANADFHQPRINACTFAVDPDVASVGFEIQLDGVNFHQEPVVSHGGNLTVSVSDVFANADAEAIQVFDISGEYWLPLAHDGVQMDGNQATLSFYAPDLSSRFAIVEGFSEAGLYNVNYGTDLGGYTSMAVNNITSWCVYGPNPYGFGNSQHGTFSMHLVRRPDSDSDGKTVGYKDYVAAGCLEYWKAEPVITEGQVVNVDYGGNIEGWSSLSRSARRTIVGYLLYGVRYISDGSFNNNLGSPTIGSRNPLINMSCAQQIVIWAAIKGVDPLKAASYYGKTVTSYAQTIIDYAEQNPENYDYNKTLVLVGEGNSRQDMALILKPEYMTLSSSDIFVVKTVTGSAQLSGWVMELYTSYAQAAQGAAPFKTAYTNEFGHARFQAIPDGTYYLREAPARRQNNNLTGWTLSDKILTVTVNGKDVTVTGIENICASRSAYRIQKTSVCSAAVQAQLAGNHMYSLQGAEYSVTLDGVLQETLVTDRNGMASGRKTYPTGTRLTIQEVKAPPGYKLDPTVYTLIITASDNLLKVSDVPLFDPPFSLTKVDSHTTGPQGDSSFGGAVFKWEYFDNNSWSGQPLRTWYLQTDARGIADLRAESLAPGYQSDPLYIDDAGNPDIPIGTVTMTEIQNSLGYTVLPEPLRCRILADRNSPAGVTHTFDDASLKWIGNVSAGNVDVLEPLDSSLLGEFQLDKIDAVTGSEPQGSTNLAAKFQIINRSAHAVRIGTGKIAQPGEICCEFLTDEAGHFSSGQVFPLGTYEITELEPPLGYELNPDWKQTFTVTPEQQSFDFTAPSGNACEDSLLLTGSFSMDKLDLETGSAPQGDGTLEGAEFELLNNSSHPIVMNGQSVAPGEIMSTFRTDTEGHYKFTGLPLGSYSLREVTPPQGYRMDSLWMYAFDITPEQLHITVTPEYACQDAVIRGGFRIVKQDLALGSSTDETVPLDGITFTITNESIHPVIVNGTLYAPGEAVMTLAISWDGEAWSAETGTVLPYGTYGVTENETAPGMANDQYLVNPGKKLVEVRDSDSVSEILYEDQRAEGKIVIHKVDPLGKPLAGARFQLQWSEDGAVWNPVVFSETIIKGGCSAPGLANGSLVSGEDGVVSFTGLHARLFYRVVEVEAPDGYVLLTGPVFEGTLPENDPVCVLTVHNSPGFTFPTTGSDSLRRISAAGFAAAALGIILLTAIKKRHTGCKKAPHF